MRSPKRKKRRPRRRATKRQTRSTNKLSQSPKQSSKDESEYTSDDEEPTVIPTEKPTKKPMLDMPTTPKILQQVECQSCGRKMSAKTLKYSHAKYCTERGREEQPEAIPIPRMEIKNGEKLKEQTHLPVKSLKLKSPKPSKPEEEEKREPIVVREPEMEQPFYYTMKLKNDQRSDKYQALLANAF